MNVWLFGAVLVVLVGSSVGVAHADAYGNPSGCSAFREDWDNVTDLMIVVTPDEVTRWERSCALANPKYDGTELRVICSGEGEEWPLIITLYIDSKRPDVMIYSETDPQSQGQMDIIELSRCD